jgi:hypothetical protein
MNEEAHPIPQDITGFQFKLIGDMTLKQFAYLAAGAIAAWIVYLLPLLLLIKLPIVVFFLGFGVALAFVPVDGRPLDTMIAYFFKAVFSPTQYIYQKQGATLGVTPAPGADLTKTLSQNQLQQFLSKVPKIRNPLDRKEMVFFQNVGAMSSSPQAPLPREIPSHYFATKAAALGTHVPQSQTKAEKKNEDLMLNENLQKTAEVLQKELERARKAEEAQRLNQIDPKAFLDTHQKVLELQNQLSEMANQKQELEKKLTEMQRSSLSAQAPVFTPSVAQAPQTTQNVRVIPQAMTKQAGIANAPEFPNVLTGIIKDPRGNPLQNILVEVKDAEGNAARAFKTNALGQFASATALSNGKYTIEFEDPKEEHKFDSIAFEANGQIIMPLEVISTDHREELRKELFATN